MRRVILPSNEDREFYEHPAHFPCLTLTTVMVRKEEYRRLVESMRRMKMRYFQRENVTLHNYDIRKKEGPFSVFHDAQIYDEFKRDMTDIFDEHGMLIVSCSVNKLKLIARREFFGEKRDPGNLYTTCMKWMLERVCHFLNSHSSSGRIIFERIGKRESREVRESCSALMKRGSYGRFFSFPKRHFSRVSDDILFCTKNDAVTGLEVADYICYAFGKHCRDPDSDNELFRILRRYVYQGDRIEYGLKE